MSVHGRTDVDYEGTDKVADLERGTGSVFGGQVCSGCIQDKRYSAELYLATASSRSDSSP